MQTQLIQAHNIIAQLNEGTARSIGWIGEGSAAKAYTGRLVDIRCHRRGIMLHVRNDVTGNIVKVLWRMSQRLAYNVITALGDLREIATALVELARHHGLDARVSRTGYACVIGGYYSITTPHQLERYLALTR
jgi:hypothetical protein